MIRTATHRCSPSAHDRAHAASSAQGAHTLRGESLSAGERTAWARQASGIQWRCTERAQARALTGGRRHLHPDASSGPHKMCELFASGRRGVPTLHDLLVWAALESLYIGRRSAIVGRSGAVSPIQGPPVQPSSRAGGRRCRTFALQCARGSSRPHGVGPRGITR